MADKGGVQKVISPATLVIGTEPTAAAIGSGIVLAHDGTHHPPATTGGDFAGPLDVDMDHVAASGLVGSDV